MKLLINIPKEFEQHFQADRFEDSLHRLSADAHLIAGLYEQETAKMLRDAFKNATPVPPHGRLIDADEQIERAWRLNLSTRELIETMLKSAPTIIPAEETLKEATNDQNNS